MYDGDMPQIIEGTAAALATVSFHDTINWKFDLDEFKSQMRSFGILDSWDMELLEARYYHNMSARRIAAEHDYVSHDTVSRRLKKLHSLLEERGYKRKKPQ